MFKQLSREQKYILIVLSLINFINYVDRQIIFPLFDVIKAEFHVSDFQLGLLGTVFMLVHSVASLPLGILADRYSRKTIIAAGVTFWSAASFASGLASSFKMLLGIRSVVGIGEAAYAPAATAIISDNLPQRVRAQAQGVFNVALFAGGTVGAMLGGVIAFYSHGWRLPFFLVSLPGLVLAFLSFRLPDRTIHHQEEKFHFLKLLKNRAYVWILVGGWLSTFASGAFVSWGVQFVTRYKGYNLRDTSLLLGGTLLVAGVLGVFTGSQLADWLQQKTLAGRSLVLAFSQMLAAPLIFLGFASGGSGALFFVYFFLGTVFLSMYYGPATAVMHDVVPASMRATAFAFYILIIHILGDTIAPAAVGKVSDLYSLRLGLEWCTVFVLLSGLAFLVVAGLLSKKRLIPL